MHHLVQDLKAAGGWPALLSESDGSRMQLLLDRLLQHRQVHIRRTAQCLLLLRSAENSGLMSATEAETMARDLLFDIDNPHRKQGPNRSRTTAPQERK